MTAPRPPALVADIGGTNARFALIRDGTAEAVEVLACANYPSLADAAGAYLATAAAPQRPRRAALAVASPVTGDRVEMTNHVWSFSIAELSAALELETLEVVNDFTAIALAVPHLGAGECADIGDGVQTAGAPIAVLGPGTGLGVSGLVPSDAGWIALATEGGHATLAPVDDRERAVVAEMARRFGHVSVERAVSGPGLVNLRAAIAAVDGTTTGPLTPDQVTERALARSDALCIEAFDMFCAMLGTAASNLALSLGARGGVYIAGGIVPRFGDAFACSPFRARFEDKGRFRDYLRAIPTRVITRDNPALLGLANLL
jgi:glucokinase